MCPEKEGDKETGQPELKEYHRNVPGSRKYVKTNVYLLLLSGAPELCSIILIV